MEKNMKKGFGTVAIHGGSEKNVFGTLATPIYQTSTFIFDSAEQGGKRFALEEEGEAALATASGMGAIASVMWTVLKAGDHVLADKTLYGCTFALLSHGLTKFGIDVEFIDTSDLEAVKSSLKSNTKVVYLETPANPNLKIVDIEAVSKLAHAYNDKLLVVVDNTFATPYCQKSLTLGADIVVHSATKYLNGHGDVIAGFVVGKMDLVTQVRLVGVKDMTGAVLSPMDAYYIIRGMKTLEIIMERHCSNARKVTEFLNVHPKVETVFYPGLTTHPGHGIACKQMKDFGGIFAFELKGEMDAGKTLLNNLELCSLAVSLGDTETLIQHPASMTHSPYTR